MTEHKFTDEQIIKALECCSDTIECSCKGCPCPPKGLETGDTCIPAMCAEALDLINRQRAEIEKWQLAYDCADSALRELSVTRSEAIKEFAERVKENLDDFFRTDEDATLDTADMIDTLAKEMTEGKQCF